MPSVGSRLRALRDSIGISQMKLGKIAGLQQAAVNRYEHGKCEAPYRVLLWYAEYFDVSIFFSNSKSISKSHSQYSKNIFFFIMNILHG